MARNIQSELEAEADRKGLRGDARAAYIGGAWQNITHGRERRSLWRGSQDHTYLAAVVGTVHDIRRPKSRPGRVVFRQGQKWYELPRSEYTRLVRAGKQIHREEERERRAIAAYYKALEREQNKEKRDQARAARQADITMDEAAMKLAHHMPWLRLETGSDVVSYFDRHRDTANVRKLRKGAA